MINPKEQLEEPKMKNVKDVISKAIETRNELIILPDGDPIPEELFVYDEDFLDYVSLVRDLLHYSELVLSKKDLSIYSSFEKCVFTQDDFFKYLTLLFQVWKVLDENVWPRTITTRLIPHLEDDFEDFMTGIRKKIFELKLEHSDVWKDFEKKIGNHHKQLEDEWMRNVQGLIVKTIHENKKVKILEDGSKADPRNFTISDDELIEYEQSLGQLLHNSLLKHYNFTDEDFHFFTKLWDELEQFLQNNLEDKEYGEEHFRGLESMKFSLPPEGAKKAEKPAPLIRIKRELASAIGITICSKCGTRTKLQYQESIEGKMGDEWIGYTTCPKCGYKEKWLSGDRG